MNRASSLSVDDWPEWQVDKNTPPVITVEGHHIQGVFSMIHTQLETLRKLSIDQGKALIEATRREEKANEKHMKTVSKLTDRIEKLQQDMRDGETGKLTERLKLAEDRVKMLEKQVSLETGSAIRESIDNHQEAVTDHEKRLSLLQGRVDESDLESQVKKIKECERQIATMNFDRGDLHTRVVHLEDETVWYKNQAEKMNEEYAKLYDNNEVSAREISHLKETVYEKHEEEIDRLFTEKLDVSEAYGTTGKGSGSGDHTATIDRKMSRAASMARAESMARGESMGGGPENDSVPNSAANSPRPPGSAGATPQTGQRKLSLFRQPADASEDIERLDNLLADLDRRLLLVSAECSSDIENVKHKSDKKIEHLQKWILKFVSQAMVKTGDGDEGGDFTDVGRIRCLVCNHPAKKLDGDTPYIKPDFRNTVGYLHDETPHQRPLPVEEGADYSKVSGKFPGAGGQVDPKYRVSNSPPRSQHPSKTASSSKFARLRAVPQSSGGGDDGDQRDDNLINVVDITQDVLTRPKTGGGSAMGGRNGGDTRGFYKEMERYACVADVYLIYIVDLSDHILLHMALFYFLICFVLLFMFFSACTGSIFAPLLLLPRASRDRFE